jgi:outer membrane receptor protein involved in Fe transport
MSRFRRSATLAALGAVVPALALAQQPARTPRDSAARAARRDSARVQRLAPVVTTASRYEADARVLPRRVEVVTRAQIDATPALDVVDVLKKRAGVDVQQYPGLLGGIGIRGFRPTVGTINQRNVVLFDGRPAGVTNLGMVDLQDVERIEVLKGPASALYGSTAMGGVVNIVTRRRTGAFQANVDATGGSFGTSELRVQGGGRVALGVDADLSVRRFDQRENMRIGDGNLFRGALAGDRAEKLYPLGNRPNRLVPDTLGDGIERAFTEQAVTSGTLRVGRAFAGDWRADARLERFDANGIPTPGDLYQAATAFPGNGRKDVDRTGYSLEVGRTAGAWRPLLRAWRTQERQGFFNRPDSARFVNFRGDIRSDGVQLQAATSRGPVSLVTGADWVRQQSLSSRFSNATTQIGTFSPDAQVTSAAAFAEARVADAAERVVATLGARVDRVALSLLATPFRPDVTPGEDAFTTFNPNVGLRYRFLNGVVLHGTAGTAFLAPDAFGRAGRSTVVASGVARITTGNANLGPERSATVDAGLGWARADGALEVDATYFSTSIQDRVASARATFAAGTRPTLPDGTPVSQVDTRVNAGRATIAGAEWTLRYDPLRARGSTKSLSFFTSGTRILRAREQSPVVTVDGTPFQGRPNFDPSAVFGGVVLGTVRTAYVYNVADLTVLGGVEYDDRRRVRFGVTGRYVGQRYDQDFSDFADISDIRYPDMLVLDLVAGIRLPRALRLDVLVGNVTDENFYEKRGYNLQGRTVQLRLGAGF